ncbi:MAG: ABC1 kinase family protein, partial [Candidatus Methanofastidiosia archaeon]
FRREFCNDPTVKIPKIFKRFGTKRLLVMEHIGGIKISDVLHLEYTEKEKAHLADIGANAVLKMIFEFGFFHADPHPANIFVVDKNTIAFLDFGIIGRINKNAKRNLTNLLIAIINKDAEKIGDILVHMMSATDVNKDELVYELEDLIDVYYNRSLEEINMGEFLQDLTLSVKRHGMKMPKNYALLGKTLIMIEGVGRQLNPSFNSVQYTKPYVKKIIMERMGPKNIVKRWYETLSQTSGMAIDIPKKIDSIMTRLSKGDFRVGVESKSMEYLTHSFERSVNRLSFSIVIAGMILSSSVLFMTNIGPKIYDLPLFGWVGFIISFTLGIWLISGIVKAGKL